MNTDRAAGRFACHPGSTGREEGPCDPASRPSLSQDRAAGHMLLPGGVSGPPRWRRVCRPIRHYKWSLMQMTSSSASSTIGQPRRAA
jgi:hypothetical protein